jgi:hypothetical protein
MENDPFIDDLPIIPLMIFISYVKFPEGKANHDNNRCLLGMSREYFIGYTVTNYMTSEFVHQTFSIAASITIT